MRSQHEELFFINAAALVWAQHLNERTSAIKLIASRALNTWASGCFEPWFHLQGAAHARGQIVVKVVTPDPVGNPAAAALAHLGIAATQGGGRFGLGVAKVHSALVKLHYHLADLRHLPLGRHADHLRRL
jgi:hypothetical protein